MMIQIETIAFILLTIRVLAIFFMTMVVSKQIKLFRQPIRSEVIVFRRILFILAIAILVGNIVPIVVDASTLVVEVARSSELSFLSVAYASSNAVTSLLSSVLIWFLYRIASESNK